jgi:putative ABC transport system ATP-binding protein
MSSAVTVEGLRFAYGHGGAFQLNVPRLELPAGSRAAFHGPSGCGKTTALHLIAGILEPTAGTVHIGDAEITAMSEADARAYRIGNIGFVFQDFALIDYLDVQHNVLYPYFLNPALQLDDGARARAQELLTRLGLGAKAKRRPSQLSQGERQRVAICRALVTQPQILMADEPTGGLDHDRADAVMDLIDGLVTERGITLLMVTHDRSLFPRFDQLWDATTWGEGGQG